MFSFSTFYSCVIKKKSTLFMIIIYLCKQIFLQTKSWIAGERHSKVQRKSSSVDYVWYLEFRMTFVLLKENKTYQHSTVHGVDVKTPASHSHTVVRRLQFIQAHSRRRHQVWNVNNNGDFSTDGTRNGVSIAIIATSLMNFSDFYFNSLWEVQLTPRSFWK